MGPVGALGRRRVGVTLVRREGAEQADRLPPHRRGRAPHGCDRAGRRAGRSARGLEEADALVTTFALSAYPISGAFRETLAGLAREPVDVLVLPELRRLGTRTLPRRLASLRGRCFIALEDPGSETLLPILETLAAFTGARTIEVVRPDGSRARVRRRDALRAVAGVGAASLNVQHALRAARNDLDTILAAPRQPVPYAGSSALVLNANL